MKLKLITTWCAFVTLATAQPYGHQTYGHSATATLTCGKMTSLTSGGFMLAGSRPSTIAFRPNFFIDRTDPGGSFSSSWSFSQEYSIYYDNTLACVAPSTQILNCAGVDVIEAVSTSGAPYFMAAAADEGCFFGGLSTAGVPWTAPNIASINFPAGSSGATKPFIVESVASTGNFYVCGSYVDASGVGTMYVFKVDWQGNVAWAYSYNNGGGPGSILIPKGIIESPYGNFAAPEIAIAGIWYGSGSPAGNEGFFTVIDGALGGNSLFAATYGQSGAQTDEFHSLALASSVAGGSAGYIIGGFTDMYLPGGGGAWMLKLSPNGTIIWSQVYRPRADRNSGPVVSITERYSSSYGYECYGAVSSTNAIIVLKVDDAGVIFNQSPNTNSEFVYNASSSPRSSVCSVDYKNSTGGDQGLHVYGTDNQIPGSFYLVEAYFNGESDCTNPNQVLQTIFNQNSGPTNTVSQSLTGTSIITTTCNNFNFFNTATSNSPNSVCGGSNSNPNGNNNKATGINSNKGITTGLTIYPNPTTDKLQLSYQGNSSDQIKIEVLNELGQSVVPAIVGKINNDGSYIQNIDFRSMNFESGIYFIRSSINGIAGEQKMIYNK